MGETLNLKSGVKTLATIRIMNKYTNRFLTPILHENTVRFVEDQNGEIYFETVNRTEFDLTIDMFNINNDKIDKIDFLRPFERVIIKHNEVLGCAMILEEYITNKGKPLMFTDEKSQCLGEIKIGFDCVFRATSSWEIDDCWTLCGGRTEIDGSGVIFNTSRALLTAGRAIEQVRFKETTTSEKFYAFIKYDLGMWSL